VEVLHWRRIKKILRFTTGAGVKGLEKIQGFALAQVVTTCEIGHVAVQHKRILI
jgi:hypothetical protein